MGGYRSKSRELVFQVVFGLGFKNTDLIDCVDIISNFESEFSGDDSEVNLKFLDRDYCLQILKGIILNKDEIDGIISKNLKRWRIERLSKVDLSILRLATYEMCFENLDPRIAINEALNISKKYSNDNSYSYINGVLNSVKDLKLEGK